MTERLDDAKPLPVILKAVPDELLSSWLSRHAAFYGMKRNEFLRRLLPHAPPQSTRAIDLDLPSSDAQRLGRFFRTDPAQIRRMTHGDLAGEARWFICPEPIQACPSCRASNPDLGVEGAVLRDSQRGWRITCSFCGSKLVPRDGLAAAERKTANDHIIEFSLWDEAVEGERLLGQFLAASDETATAALAAFRMLLVPRPRLPHVNSEQAFKLHAVDALLPGVDEIAKQNALPTRWKNHVIAPLRVRPRLLAGFRRLLEKPRPRFHILRSVTLGNYRLRLETLGDQAAPVLGPLWFS
jgi:hypothetical protein